ncbi:unnamed protein product [Symbiodinium sp. CCMP2592]|nr:unnamed protein product [Symbiodinium sp. CCMP2592]
MASASGQFVPGNMKAPLGDLNRSHTVRMLQQSSKYSPEKTVTTEPTEIASTPRKAPETRETLSIEVGDSPPEANGDQQHPPPSNGKPNVRRQLFPSLRRVSPKKKAAATPKPDGEQLRKLLLDHGTFQKVEGALEKWHLQKKKSAEKGGLVTKEWLVQKRTMADNAFEWARRNGRLFKSEIHGAEEADIPLEWSWENSNESGQKTGFTSSFSMDVPSHIEVENFLISSLSLSLSLCLSLSVSLSLLLSISRWPTRSLTCLSLCLLQCGLC